MVWVEGAVIEKGLMLLHSGIKRSIVFFGPSSQGVEQENGVLVTLGEELVSGVVQQEDVSVVEGVSDLESIDNISISLGHEFVDSFGAESVLVE